MVVRPYKTEDYETIRKWWKARADFDFTEGILPLTAFVSYTEDTDVAAAFMYLTDTDLAILTWIVGNPDISFELRDEGIRDAIKSCVELADNAGVKVICGMTSHEGLCQKFKREDFTYAEQVSHLYRSL